MRKEKNMSMKQNLSRKRLESFKEYLAFPGGKSGEGFSDCASHVGINEDGSFGVSELTLLWNRRPRILADDAICRVRVRDEETDKLLLQGKVAGYCTPAEIFEEIEDGWLRAESYTVYTDVNTILFAFSLQNTDAKPHRVAPILSGLISRSELPTWNYPPQQVVEVLSRDPDAATPIWPEIPPRSSIQYVRSAEYMTGENILALHSVEPPTDARDSYDFFDLDFTIRPSFQIKQLIVGPEKTFKEKAKEEGGVYYEGEGELTYELMGEELVLNPGEKRDFFIGLSFSLNNADFPLEKARWFGKLANPMDSVEKARSRWMEIFSRIPSLEIEPRTEQAYLQAVYALYQNLVAPWESFSTLKHHYGCFVNKLQNAGSWPDTTPNVLPAFAEFDPDMAKEVAFSFADAQGSDGYIGGVGFSKEGFDERSQKFTRHPFARAVGYTLSPGQVSVGGFPPTIFWACWRCYERTGDREFLQNIYPSLIKNMDWWYMACYVQKDGLFRVMNLSDYERPGDLPYREYSVWTSGFILVSLRCLVRIAAELGLEDDAAKWTQKAENLAQAILRMMYCAEDNMFYNISMDTHAFGKFLSVGNFAPLWGGVPLETEDAKSMLRDYLLNPEYFFSEIPFPELSYNDPFYDSSAHDCGTMLVCFVPPLLETLWMYKLKEEAEEAARRVIAVMSREPTIYGEYETVNGKGIFQPNCSWAAAVFIEILLERYKVEKFWT